ncbi:MAG: flagellar hook-length control protein FliK, partial [Asticcacaulis sp.]
PATPVSYTAAAIQADAPAPLAQAPAAQTPASLMSQTAVQTLSALSVQIGKRLSDGNTKFSVELHPADLGRVDVALTIDRDGRVNAHLDFDTPMTAAAFSTHENELRQQLTQAGLNVDAGALTFASRDADSQTATAFASNLSGGDSSSNGSNAFLNQNPQHQQPQPNSHDALRALAAANSGADEGDLAMLSMLSGQGSTLALNLIV